MCALWTLHSLWSAVVKGSQENISDPQTTFHLLKPAGNILTVSEEMLSHIDLVLFQL